MIKRMLFIILMVLFISIPTVVADTFTGNTIADWMYIGNRWAKMVITWVDAAIADGVTGTIYIPTSLYGYLFYCVVTDPGATAPDDNYAIALTKSNGENVFDSTTIDRDYSVTETAWPTGYHVVDGDLTFTLTANTEDDATGTVTMYLLKP